MIDSGIAEFIEDCLTAGFGPEVALAAILAITQSPNKSSNLQPSIFNQSLNLQSTNLQFREPPLWLSLTASVVRALPFGRYQLSNAIAKVASAGPFVARMPRDLGGARFICDLRDSIAREVCFTGRYEPQETQLAMRLLAQGMFVVDVGANWGYFSLACAHRVGASGRVLALEPHPGLSAMLAENVRVNGLAQVELLGIAAGKDRG